jgi:hypothetical protein
MVPPWTRIYRIQRDIPMPLVTSGVDHGNLRELAGTAWLAYSCALFKISPSFLRRAHWYLRVGRGPVSSCSYRLRCVASSTMN